MLTRHLDQWLLAILIPMESYSDVFMLYVDFKNRVPIVMVTTFISLLWYLSFRPTLGYSVTVNNYIRRIIRAGDTSLCHQENLLSHNLVLSYVTWPIRAVHVNNISYINCGCCRIQPVAWELLCKACVPPNDLATDKKNRPTMSDKKYRPISSPTIFFFVGGFCLRKSVGTHRFGCPTKRCTQRPNIKIGGS